MSTQLTLRYIPLSQAKRWDRNPKRHDIGAICQSIERHGFRDPPAYDAALDAFAEGNGRTDALEALYHQKRPVPKYIAVSDTGEWCLPVIFGGDSPSRAAAEAYGIDHNNLTLSGGDFDVFEMAKLWDADYTALLEELARADELPVSVDGDALDALLAEVIGVEAAEDAPVEIDESQPTRVQPGEVWRVGRHLVACLDSTDRATVERLVGGRKVGMVWADPPYGIKAASSYADGKVHKGMISPRGKFADLHGDNDTQMARRSAACYLELLPQAVQIWWGANHYADTLPASSCWIVWDKENPGVDFADGELAWCNQKLAIRIFRHQWMGIWKDSEHGERRAHPTQKPIALCEWAFDKYGAADDLILDPFLGSGPSLKAAQRMPGERTVIGFELSPHYCDHVIEWAEAQGLTCERLP